MSDNKQINRLTAIRKMGPVTGQPFWRVQISDGDQTSMSFGRNLKDAILRAGHRLGITEDDMK